MILLISIYVFVLGACIGSFFNVCIYRMPMEQSVVKPRSYCPNCREPIHWFHNIPIFSYLMLRGKSYCCKKNIPLRYILIEVFTACWSLGWFLFFFQSHFLISQSVIYFLLFLSFIVVTIIDLDHMIIPDEITIYGTILGIGYSVIFPEIHNVSVIWQGLLLSLFGVLVGGGILWGIAWMGEKFYRQEVMGFGDVKLLALVGSIGGWQVAFLTIMLGSIIGSIFGGMMILSRKKGLRTQIPFGPYLVVGAMIAILFHQEIIDWYLSISGISRS